MISRLFASAAYRLNTAPLLRLPAGSENWIANNRDYAAELDRDATALIDRIPAAKGDLLGAGKTDYLFLYRYILKRRPARVLELGSGISTLFLAAALEEAGCGQLVTVDHVQRFSDGARQRVPDSLLHRVEFVVSHATGELYRGISAIRYDEIPKGHYDMVFVDGPPVIIGDTAFPSSDVLHLLSDRPTDIIVDKRVTTLHRYAQWLTKPVQFDPVCDLGFVKGATAKSLPPSA